MESNETLRKDKRLVKSKEQAEIALKILSQNWDCQKENLQDGILKLVEGLNNPDQNKIITSYPSLLQEYELSKLLSGDIAFENASKQDIRTAGLLSCLQLIIDLYSSTLKNSRHFFEMKNSNETKEYDCLCSIIQSICLDEFIEQLFYLIIDVVGIEYYQNFQLKVNVTELILESVLGFKMDSEIQKHLDLMIWFPLVRIFVEYVFIHFDE